MISKSIFFSLHMTLSIVLILFFLLTPCYSLRPYYFTHHSKGTNYKDGQSHTHIKEGEIGMELYPMGSSLPDCSYACGPCAPCRRVMVSFMTCSVESCPVVYRCVCKGRFFHVPSN